MKPYFEFHFMDDKTHQEIAPSALFQFSSPNDPTRQRQLQRQLQQPVPERAAAGNHWLFARPMVAADAASISGTARRPIRTLRSGAAGNPQPQHRSSKHRRRRALLRLRTHGLPCGRRPQGGALGNAWSYDAYAQYYYVDFFNR